MVEKEVADETWPDFQVALSLSFIAISRENLSFRK